MDTGVFTTSSSNGYQAVSYDDSGWASGSAPLGFGYSDIASVISFGTNASNKYPAAFFRKSFFLTDTEVDSTNAPLNITVNFVHGARCYLNGVEIYRKNLPTVGVVDGYVTAPIFAQSLSQRD